MAIPSTLYKVQVRLNMDSGITADAITNTWHFASGLPIADVPAAWVSQVEPDLRIFYGTLGPDLSADIDANNMDWKLYHAATPPPNPPIGLGTFAPFGLSSVAAPPELAMVVSFQAPPVAGISQARRRNRVYIGPLGFVSTGGLIPSTKTDAFRDAAQAFLDASDTWADFSWVVYSPTSQTMDTVTNGWVDNAYDIQRRRGLTATSRDLFSL